MELKLTANLGLVRTCGFRQLRIFNRPEYNPLAKMSPGAIAISSLRLF
jgi:hypothetical protein